MTKWSGKLGDGKTPTKLKRLVFHLADGRQIKGEKWLLPLEAFRLAEDLKKKILTPESPVDNLTDVTLE